MWEAKSAAEWEKQSSRLIGHPSGNRSRLESVGDLALAHMQREGTIQGLSDLGTAPDDALDNWHAGTDGLGMLLAAIIADMC